MSCLLVCPHAVGNSTPSKWSGRLLVGLTAAAMALMAVPSMLVRYDTGWPMSRRARRRRIVRLSFVLLLALFMAIGNAYQAGASEIQIGKTQILLGYPAPGKAASTFAGQDNLFCLSKEFLASNPSQDDILRAILEEDIHLARARAGHFDDLLNQGVSQGFRQEAAMQAEEGLVSSLTEDLFQSGRQRGWW